MSVSDDKSFIICLHRFAYISIISVKIFLFFYNRIKLNQLSLFTVVLEIFQIVEIVENIKAQNWRLG